MSIVLINQSEAITDAEVQDIADACDHQLRNEVASAWGIKHPLHVSTTGEPKSYPFFLVDEIPEAPGALAYHYVQDDGVPAGKIGVTTTLDAHESVSSATSHEAVELQCDIFCASWSYSDRLACLVATEACDPVQSDTYRLELANGASVEVSNFVTPYYFTEDPLGQPLDHLRTLTRTFGIAKGGYQIRMKGGKVTNVFGADFSQKVRAGKEASHGRTFWRNVTMALAALGALSTEPPPPRRGKWAPRSGDGVQERMSLRRNQTVARTPNTTRYPSCTTMPAIMSCE